MEKVLQKGLQKRQFGVNPSNALDTNANVENFSIFMKVQNLPGPYLKQKVRYVFPIDIDKISIVSDKPVILLDVMVENLLDLLKDGGWTVETVSDKLGVTSENRDDSKILDYADENNRVVITEDKKFIDRLEGKGIGVFTIKDYEKADIIDGKLKKMFG